MASNGSSSTAEAGSSAGTGISFSITKRSSQPSHSSVGDWMGKKEGNAMTIGGGISSDAGDKDLVFSLEGGNIHSSKPVAKKKEYVVPLIRKIVWRGLNNDNEGDGMSVNESVKSEAELALDKEAAEAIMSDLNNIKSDQDEDGRVIPLLLENKPPVREDAMDTSEIPDLHMRPEPVRELTSHTLNSTADDYEEMPIGEFGKAMLRGMGWNDGNAIGKTNKGIVAPIEFIPRMGKLGLGAAPKPQAMPVKKRPRKPGETDKKLVQGPYIDTDGRVKHTRLIGEEIPDQPIEGYRPGNYARVVSGPHVGLSGKIISADEDDCRVSLRLAVNGQVLDFSQHRLELISKDEYVKPPPPPARQSSSKQCGLIREKGVSDEPCSSKSLLQTSTDDREFRQASSYNESRDRKKRLADRHSDKHYERAKRSKHSSDVSGSESHSIKSSRTHASEISSHGESSRERVWVAPNLRVRIVDTEYKRGKYYNNKVVIVDVVSGAECVCQTSDGRHLEGVYQSMLETVVPKTENAAVMIVGGKKHKREIGRLLERDSKNYKATVELVYSSKILALDYDNICEYTGDVED